jgi:secretion/DNA translocation related CpaE-like protein
MPRPPSPVPQPTHGGLATADARPLIVTDDLALLDDLLRLAAAAGVEVEVMHDATKLRRAWVRASQVVIGADRAVACVEAALPRRSGVVLVGADLDDATVWEPAVRLGAEQVVFLPDAEAWLVDLLAGSGEPPVGQAPVIAVVGGRGGAGATTLATALARTAARRGLRALLVDADRMGGGIDLAIGAEYTEGMRWPDLGDCRKRLPRRLLTEGLPRVDEVAVLSWGRGDPPQVGGDAMAVLLDGARRAQDVIVIDLPRWVDELADVALGRATMTLVVVPAEIRAAAAAERVIAAVSARCPDVRAVVRGPAPGGLTGDTVALSLGLPLAAFLRAEPGLAEAMERGQPPGRRGRPLARFCERVLSELELDSSRVAS